ncbi:MAG TPA: peptidyl-prolyl cis-trans isomerase [Holophagaceae bacterium]|nr:peptidyl-prolyl cis-trans isomerase [Holophagaceae bacterium]
MKRVLASAALLALGAGLACKKASTIPPPPPGSLGAQPDAIGKLKPEEASRVREEILVIVNSHIITRRTLQQAVEEQNAALYRQFSGAELDEKLKTAREQTLQGLIDADLLQDKAADLGIKITDEQMRAQIDQIKKENNFATDADLEKALRASVGIGLDDFIKRQKVNYLQQQVLGREVYSKIAVEDSELQAYYQQHLADYAQPARFRVRELVIAKGASPEEADAAKAKMAEVQKALQGGAKFEDLVKQYSTAASKDTDGDLGWMQKGLLQAQLEQAAWALQPGAVSPLLETDKDLILLQLIAKEDTPHQPLAEVKDKILEKVQEPKAKNAVDRYLQDLRTRANIRFMVPKDEILKG